MRRIETAAEAGVSAIVVEARKTLPPGREEIERLSGELKMSIFAMEETTPGCLVATVQGQLESNRSAPWRVG